MDLSRLVRPEVWGDNLWRPDWTVSAERPPEKQWLDKNENLDPELNRVIMNVHYSLGKETIYGYPDLSSLYSKLSKSVGVTPYNLLLSHGSDGVIRSMFEAFVQPGDKVLVTSPTFVMYEVYSKMYGANVVNIDYEPSDDGPILDLDELKSIIVAGNIKMLCLPNPDSPTGTVIAEDDLKEIITECLRNDTLVLIDEAYYPFCEITAVPWIEDFENLIVARTFAKAWGMAGLRIGYAVGQKSIISILHKVKPMYEVNSIAAAVVENMLDYADEVNASVVRLRGGMRYFSDKVNSFGWKTLLGHCNFLHVMFPESNCRIHQVLEQSVLYKRSWEHKSLQGYSRISAAPIDVMDMVIGLLSKVK